MLMLPVFAALGASLGGATGIVLAQWPARQLGAFEFTRIQLIACSAILAAGVSGLGLWETVRWEFWSSFVASTGIGIVLGNLAMIECLGRGGPRRTELLLSLKAPLVGVMAYFWLNETQRSGSIGSECHLVRRWPCRVFGSDERSESDATNGTMAMIIVLGVAATAFWGLVSRL